MTAALIGAAIVWAVLSPTAALVLGRVMRARDRQIPTAPPMRVGGEDPAHRRALRLVR